MSEKESQSNLKFSPLFAERIRAMMDATGMSRAAVASRIGCAPSTISGYYQGKQMARDETAHKLAEIFGVSYEWLIGEDDATACRYYKHVRCDACIPCGECLWNPGVADITFDAPVMPGNCIINPGVDCTVRTCNSCGWNPIVAYHRKQAARKESVKAAALGCGGCRYKIGYDKLMDLIEKIPGVEVAT